MALNILGGGILITIFLVVFAAITIYLYKLSDISDDELRNIDTEDER